MKDRVVDILKEVYDGAPMRGIEIGVLWGDFTSTVLNAFPNLVMTCIDKGVERDQYNVTTAPYKDRITLIEKQSDDAVAEMNGLYDFVLVDGDHAYEQCKRDILNYTPFVKPGGFLFVHDYGSWSGVTQACEELLKDFVKDIDLLVWKNV